MCIWKGNIFNHTEISKGPRNLSKNSVCFHHRDQGLNSFSLILCYPAKSPRSGGYFPRVHKLRGRDFQCWSILFQPLFFFLICSRRRIHFMNISALTLELWSHRRKQTIDGLKQSQRSYTWGWKMLNSLAIKKRQQRAAGTFLFLERLFLTTEALVRRRKIQSALEKPHFNKNNREMSCWIKYLSFRVKPCADTN